MFNADNFAHCPMHLIMKALRLDNEAQLLTHAQNATPIAIAATAILKSKGVKEAKPDWFNPYSKALEKMALRKILRKEAAQTFLELEKDGRLVPWLYHHREVYDQIKLIVE